MKIKMAAVALFWTTASFAQVTAPQIGLSPLSGASVAAPAAAAFMAPSPLLLPMPAASTPLLYPGWSNGLPPAAEAAPAAAAASPSALAQIEAATKVSAAVPGAAAETGPSMAARTMDGSAARDDDRSAFPSPFYGSAADRSVKTPPWKGASGVRKLASRPKVAAKPTQKEFFDIAVLLYLRRPLDALRRAQLTAAVESAEKRGELQFLARLAVLATHDHRSHWIAEQALHRITSNLIQGARAVDARKAYASVLARPQLSAAERDSAMDYLIAEYK